MVAKRAVVTGAASGMGRAAPSSCSSAATRSSRWTSGPKGWQPLSGARAPRSRRRPVDARRTNGRHRDRWPRHRSTGWSMPPGIIVLRPILEVGLAELPPGLRHQRRIRCSSCARASAPCCGMAAPSSTSRRRRPRRGRDRGDRRLRGHQGRDLGGDPLVRGRLRAPSDPGQRDLAGHHRHADAGPRAARGLRAPRDRLPGALRCAGCGPCRWAARRPHPRWRGSSPGCCPTRRGYMTGQVINVDGGMVMW